MVHDFVPSSIHSGGLRYHGMSPLVSHVLHDGLIEAAVLHQAEWFEAGVEFARTQGIVAAPEPSHAIAQARREALAAKESGDEKVIVFGLSGHGLLEISDFDQYLHGNLTDDALSADALAESLAGVPEI